MAIKDLPADAQPREKLLARGPAALADAELLAILLRTGIVGKGVLQMAQELLDPPRIDPATGRVAGGFGGIAGLLHTSADDLRRIKGLGPAKRAELVAVLELARRALAQQLREREVFDSADAVKHYLQLHLAAKGHEVFAVLFLDAQNRLLAMEELFRGTLTQTSVYPREVVLRALHYQAAAVVLQQDARARVNVLSECFVPFDQTMGVESFLDRLLIPHLTSRFTARRENFLFVLDPACFQRSQVNEATIAQAVQARGFRAMRASTNDPEFGTCKAAIAAGYGNYVRGKDPEYEWYNDRDGDGVVCEH